jgi:predicted DNA-binding protein (MmcQ/YjbR family)
LTITNHKDIDAEIEILLSTYGDNLKITWDPTNVASLVKANASLYKIIFKIKANQVVSLKWKEDYTP